MSKSQHVELPDETPSTQGGVRAFVPHRYPVYVLSLHEDDQSAKPEVPIPPDGNIGPNAQYVVD